MNDRLFLEYQAHFDAAHYLKGYLGPCANLHGHRWEVRIGISGTVLNEVGILVDFRDLKDMMKAVLPDHQCLNDLAEFAEMNPTAENLAGYLFRRIDDYIQACFCNDGFKEAARPVRLDWVRVYESPGACALVERGAE